MDVFTKHPTATEHYDFDFTEALPSAVTLATVVNITADPTGDLTIMPGMISGSRVQTLISGGVDGRMYRLLCRATTSVGETLEVCGGLAVKAC